MQNIESTFLTRTVMLLLCFGIQASLVPKLALSFASNCVDYRLPLSQHSMPHRINRNLAGCKYPKLAVYSHNNDFSDDPVLPFDGFPYYNEELENPVSPKDLEQNARFICRLLNVDYATALKYADSRRFREIDYYWNKSVDPGYLKLMKSTNWRKYRWNIVDTTTDSENYEKAKCKSDRVKLALKNASESAIRCMFRLLSFPLHMLKVIKFYNEYPDAPRDLFETRLKDWQIFSVSLKKTLEDSNQY
eukprot:NODE_145_length_17646_cov_0.204536.p6 type:complete len:247 gc:universal NODE_145_length_17646_cov_0.204536:15718-14978(-)